MARRERILEYETNKDTFRWGKKLFNQAFVGVCVCHSLSLHMSICMSYLPKYFHMVCVPQFIPSISQTVSSGDLSDSQTVRNRLTFQMLYKVHLQDWEMDAMLRKH